MKSALSLFFSAALVAPLATTVARGQEVMLPGHTVLEDYVSPLPHTYLQPHQLPKAFSWSDVGGKSYLTHSLNQHIPQYCGELQ